MNKLLLFFPKVIVQIVDDYAEEITEKQRHNKHSISCEIKAKYLRAFFSIFKYNKMGRRKNYKMMNIKPETLHWYVYSIGSADDLACYRKYHRFTFCSVCKRLRSLSFFQRCCDQIICQFCFDDINSIDAHPFLLF